MLNIVQSLLPKKLQLSLLSKLFRLAIPYWRGINRNCDPRKWSNEELRKIAKYFTGDIINVAGGDDSDKEDAYYRSYFTNAQSYAVANYPRQYLGSTKSNDLFIDLSQSIEDNSTLLNSYNAVFTHTVLEHIYDLKTAIANLCQMSSDVVISVVPFIQAFHHKNKYYHDYWRFTPYSLKELFDENGFGTIYCNWNSDPIGNIYILHVASKNINKWDKIIALNPTMGKIAGPGCERQMVISNIRNKYINDGAIQMKQILGARTINKIGRE